MSGRPRWEAELERRIAQRNAIETEPFQELIRSHGCLSMMVNSMKLARDESNEAARRLTAENETLRRDLQDLQRGSGNSTVLSVRESELKKKLETVQQQLNEALKQTSDYFKFKHENLEMKLKQTELMQSLAEKDQAIAKLTAECKDKDDVNALLKAERHSAVAEGALLREKTVRLEGENERFLSDLMAAKQLNAELQVQNLDLEQQLIEFRQKGGTNSNSGSPAGENTSMHASPSAARFLSFGGFSGGGCVIPTSAVRTIDDAHRVDPTFLTASETGKLWSASHDKTMKCWDSNLIVTSTTSLAVAPMCLHTSANRLALGFTDNTSLVYDVSTSRRLCQLSGHTDHISSISLFPNGHRVATSSDDQTIRVWDVSTSATIVTFMTPSRCRDVCTVEDRLFTGHFDGSIKIWDSRASDVKPITIKTEMCAQSVRVGPDCNTIVSLHRDHTLRVHDIRTLQQVGGVLASDKASSLNPTLRLALSPDGRFCASGSPAGVVLVWSLSGGSSTQPIATLQGGHKGGSSITSIAWLPEGKGIATVATDKKLCLWK